MFTLEVIDRGISRVHGSGYTLEEAKAEAERLTGDTNPKSFPNTRVTWLLGWESATVCVYLYPDNLADMLRG